MSWDDVGKSNRSAANSLKSQYPRSCLRRAYYAAFSVLNERLLAHEKPPGAYETHQHQAIPRLIEKHLFPNKPATRRSLRATITRLYEVRLAADYKLTRTVDRAVALSALRDAKAIFNLLGVSNA